MKTTSSHNGFVLPTAIFLLAVCSLAILSVLGYVAFTTRMTAIHLGNSVCRLAAQSAIESAKRDIYRAFYAYSGGSSVRIGTMTGNAFNWFLPLSFLMQHDWSYAVNLPVVRIDVKSDVVEDVSSSSFILLPQ